MKYLTYEILSYDVWGNEKDGFEVNDTHRTGYTCRIPENADNAAIVRALKRCGWLKKTLKTKSVDFSYNDAIMRDEWTPIYFNDARNGRPEGELRRIDKED